ncbi:MAG TPA: LicD family protein [Marmoricola sp.]|nr:LicD family protein [Marmoricola sp.]
MASIPASYPLELDGSGLWFHYRERIALDVLVSGHRVWSFDPGRDAQRHGDRWLVPWPAALRKRLHGRGRVTVRAHLSGTVYYDAETSFGGAGELSVVDGQGRPLAVAKNGQLSPMFGEAAGSRIDVLADEITRALAFLTEAGVAAFVSYGTLLGAVRDGHFIGHDDDADVAFLSRHECPADVILESFRLERLAQRAGWRTRRMSGATFKLMVDLPDGPPVGIDVFAGFFLDGVFHLMGSVRGRLAREAVLPLGEVRLEGRAVPAPARPEEVLALTYGPGWRQPDPTFKYVLPRGTRKRFSGWMRGERVLMRYWNEQLDGAPVPQQGGSSFARWTRQRLDPGAVLVDMGAGAGRDARFFAEAGHRVVCYDYSAAAITALRRLVATPGSIDAHRFNLYDLREVLATAALHAHRGDVDAVYARDLLSTLTDDGRRHLWLFSRMVLHGSGRLFVECAVHGRSAHQPFAGRRRRALSLPRLVEEVELLGGHVEASETVAGGPAARRRERKICRLVVRWG